MGNGPCAARITMTFSSHKVDAFLGVGQATPEKMRDKRDL